MQVSELPVESSRFAPDENDMIEKFAQTMANGPIMDNIRMMAMQQDRFAQDQARVAQDLARVAQDQSKTSQDHAKAALANERNLAEMVNQISRRFESILERTLGSLNQGPLLPTQQQVQSLPMAQTYILAAPVTVPVAQMTVPQAAPMPTIQQVQNPPPVAFPQQTWHDQPGQPWPYHNPQAQQNVPLVNVQPATPAPVRPPPMVIPMAVGGQPFPREPLLDQGGRNRGRNNYADINPLLMAGGRHQGGRPTYRKPYPEFIDEVKFPRNFRIPEFATFNGKGEQSTLEYISRFTVQCGEAAANPWLKVRLFPNTLTGYAFRWYSNLPANSIQSWQQFEDLFHTQFYRAELEVSVADLSRLHQLPGESVMSFLSKFRRAKFKCNLSLPPEEYVKMALNGLEFELRKKFKGVQFHDLFDLAGKVAKYEELLREEQDKKNSSKGTYYRNLNYEVYTTEIEGEFEVNVAELNIKKAYTCKALTKPKSATANLQAASGSKWKGADSSRSYFFDISKA
ncbi:uncharacterized protein LOC132316183 [Cornus florida]|uniref:uncharacterized protein LOC132316183 n=1 Tax=Cornus florida TaxID=4283 RepID=UPI0028A13A52|nr:uncharacterized protein LOC132316183 [Cornus florida]